MLLQLQAARRTSIRKSNTDRATEQTPVKSGLSPVIGLDIASSTIVYPPKSGKQLSESASERDSDSEESAQALSEDRGDDKKDTHMHQKPEPAALLDLDCSGLSSDGEVKFYALS